MHQRPRLNFTHLRYLEALVEERSVTRAADQVGISQPAMSTILAKLREALGDVLMVQTRNGMVPTLLAVELARRSREIAAILEGRGEPPETFLPAESTAHFRIMASDGLANAFMPLLMKVAGIEAPNMRFSVHPGDPRRIQDYVRDGDFDLIITFVRNPAADLRQVMLLQQKVVWIAREEHPRVSGEPSLAQFLGEHHVRWGGPPMGSSTMEELVDEVLEKLGHVRRVNLQVSSLHILPEVVAKTDLLAVVPEHLARAAQRNLPIQVLPLPLDMPPVEISLVWHERMQHDAGHKWLRQALVGLSKELVAPPVA